MRKKVIAIGFIVALMVGATLPSTALAHGGPGCKEFGQVTSEAAQVLSPGTFGGLVSNLAKQGVIDDRILAFNKRHC